MQATIYIRKENEDRWDGITDKSAWVNAYLAKSPPNSIVEKENLERTKESTGILGVAPHVSTTKRYPDLTPIEEIDELDNLIGKHCCGASKPCKHWSWDGVGGVWVNELTGKTREA